MRPRKAARVAGRRSARVFQAIRFEYRSVDVAEDVPEPQILAQILRQAGVGSQLGALLADVGEQYVAVHRIG